MKNFFLSRSIFSTLPLAVVALSCGQKNQETPQSEVQFLKLTEKKAQLESKDFIDASQTNSVNWSALPNCRTGLGGKGELNPVVTSFAKSRAADTFLFGFRAMETKNFFTTALSLDFRPVASKLVVLNDNTNPCAPAVPRLFVLDEGQGGYLMAFDVERNQNGIAVDFGSAGNDIAFYEGVVNPIGGQLTDREPSAQSPAWVSDPQKPPKVTRIQQDRDTAIADVLHTVSYTRAGAGSRGETRTGSVSLRLYLARQKASVLKNRVSVGEARANNIGFFGSDPFAQDEKNAPIARYGIDPSGNGAPKTIYLKNFPANMLAPAKEAVVAWNISFGFEAFKVEVAPEGIDLGDPRYNVIKWFDGLEKEVPWAGYAPTLVDPTSGEVVATQILINGSGLTDMAALAGFTNETKDGFKKLSGRIGNVPVVEGAGESPVVTFYTDSLQDNPEEYVKAYYRSVIMHEFGHSLGLRHNFKASTQPDAQGNPASVMDYEPNIVASRRIQPGFYDMAAVRFGYFSEVTVPKNELPFCTDEDLESDYFCNQGDLGDPAAFTIASLRNGVELLRSGLAPLPEFVEQPMLGSIRNSIVLKKKVELLGRCDSSFEDFAAKTKDSLNNVTGFLKSVLSPSFVAENPVGQKNLVILKSTIEAGLSAGAALAAPTTCPTR
jgi:hypothetical protein